MNRTLKSLSVVLSYPTEDLVAAVPAIREAIAATKIEASTGTISFNALGEVRKDVQVQVVKGSRHRVLSGR